VAGDRLRLRAAYEAPSGAYVRAEATGDAANAADADAVIDEVAGAIESALAAA
jgi:hypothetical protein